MPHVRKPDYAGGRRHCTVPIIRPERLGAVLVCGAALTALLLTASGARATAAAKAPARPTSPAARPAPPPGFQELSQLAFLTGSWVGQLKAMPIFLDISIRGAADRVGGPLNFQIHAEPPKNALMKIGLEGDYKAVASYSETHKAVRAVLTDTGGRGVEMLGEKEPSADAWLFNSTAQGAPFPFKVRVKPVGSDQIVVAYSSGGRMPLKYEVVFNRVDG